MKFNFSGEMPEYLKGFGFEFRSQQQQQQQEPDWDADLYQDIVYVDELNPQNYERTVQERDSLLVVVIYNPHCNPCRTFTMEFATAAQRLYRVVPVRV